VRFISYLRAAILVAPLLCAQPPLAETRARLETWLEATGLQRQLTTEKLRFVSTFENPDARRLHWELRLLASLEDAKAQPLIETLFYRLLHESRVRRRDAVVNLFLADEATYAVFVAPDTGRLTVTKMNTRGTVRKTIPLPTFTNAGVPLKTSPQQLERRITNWLKSYLTDRPGARVTPQTPESDYAGVEVEGLRRKVVLSADYWENLRIDIEIKRDPLRATCHVNGRYASGRGAQLPDPRNYEDFGPQHKSDLEKFTNSLLDRLQRDLAEEP